MSDRLREIAERERAATPGPWIEGGGRSDFAVVNPRLPHPSEHQVRYDGHPIAECEFYDSAEARRNCDFICEARDDIPWLLNNTRNAIDYCDRILAHNQSGAELMFLGEVKRILTGESDGRPTSEARDAK